jgi:predicted amino acid dehydrogenase
LDDTFAFIIHPIDPKRDVARKFPTLARILPVPAIDFFSLFFPPIYLSEIRGIRSVASGRSLRGWFIACPLTPARFLRLPPAVVYRKIAACGRMAERLGARLLGLGAYTSVVGDAGVSVARRLRIPVTTGDSYTVAMALRGLYEGARRVGILPREATAAVVGAGGAIGSACAELLARDVARLVLVGRRPETLGAVAARAAGQGAAVEVAGELAALRAADLVIAVSSALEALIEPEHLRAGAVVCDVARPRDVSRRVAEQRPDVLVVEGGMVAVPGPVDFGFDFGFPPGMAYACMAETMVLALAGRYESYTLGKSIAVAQVEAIERLAEEHGFRLGGLRSFERAVTEDEIANVRARARERRLAAGAAGPA